MRKHCAIDAILPRTRQGILAATLLQPDKAWYLSELARRMGVPSSSLQRELRDLEEAGVLKMYRRGRMAYYQANTDSPIYPESAYFDGCRQKRNRCEYDFAGGVTDTDAESLLMTVKQFAVDVEAWIAADHPALS